MRLWPWLVVVAACGTNTAPIAPPLVGPDAGPTEEPDGSASGTAPDAGPDADAGLEAGCVMRAHFRDQDGDGYGTGEPVQRCDDGEPGWSLFAGDCADDDPRAFPGQDVLQEGTVSDAGGGDFDCDGTATLESIAVAGCNDQAAGGLCAPQGQLPAWYRPPFTTRTAPSCGVTAEWVTACGAKLAGGGCAVVLEPRAQRCL